MTEAPGRRPAGTLSSLSMLGLACTGVVALVATSAIRPAAAVDVEGSVELPRAQPTAPAGRLTHYWDQWNGVLDPRPRRRDLAAEVAVVLTGPGAPAEELPPLMLQNGGLRPRTLVARAGSVLEIRNVDPVSYELMSETLPTFVAVATPPGNTRRLEVGTAPGVHTVTDRAYPHVNGHLHILPDLVSRAEVARDGSYRFRGVPAGPYVLRVYRGTESLHTSEVVVPERRDLSIPALRLL
ncbi:MAG: hypothetical protein ACFCGT_18020 [Sandaracinaceae bacterium]